MFVVSVCVVYLHIAGDERDMCVAVDRYRTEMEHMVNVAQVAAVASLFDFDYIFAYRFMLTRLKRVYESRMSDIYEYRKEQHDSDGSFGHISSLSGYL